MAWKHYDADKVAEVVADFRANGEKDLKGIAKKHGVTTRTVQRWSGKEGHNGPLLPTHVDSQDVEAKVDAQIDVLVPKWEIASSMSVDKLIELIPTTKSAYHAALIAGISTDKRQILRGLATSKVDVQVTYSVPGTFRAYVQGLRDARALEAPKLVEIIDVTPKRGPEE